MRATVGAFWVGDLGISQTASIRGGRRLLAGSLASVRGPGTDLSAPGNRGMLNATNSLLCRGRWRLLRVAAGRAADADGIISSFRG